MEFSGGRNRECRGGLHWLAEVEPMFDQMTRSGVQVCTMIATNVYAGTSTAELPLAKIKRRLGCRDRVKSRCSIWENGSAELRRLGVLEDAGQPDVYRVVMPDPVTQNVKSVTSNVKNVTQNVKGMTQNVKNLTFHVTPIKEVESKSSEETEETQSACVREAADRCFAEYPANRRTNPSNFARLFAVAVEAWAVRYGIEADEALAQVEARTLAHVRAHRQARRDDRYFPSAGRFFDEHIDNEPDQPELSPEGARRKALEGLAW